MAGELAVRAAALRAGRRRLCGALHRRRRLARALRDQAHPPLRVRPGDHADHRADRHQADCPAVMAGLWRRCGAAGACAAHGPCRQRGAALDRSRRHAVAAQRVDEDRPGAGAGPLVPQGLLGAGGQSAVPGGADRLGAGAGGADPEGAQSGHRRHLRGDLRCGVPRRRGALVEGRAGGGRHRHRRPHRLRPSARLSARPHHHLPPPRE